MNIDEFIEHTQETARKHRYHADFFDINNPMRVACIKSAEDCEQLAEWLEKSKEYQHLEEQGRLVKLPCKVRDTIYGLHKAMVCELDTETIGISKTPSGEILYLIDGWELDKGDFGKTVFLTREKAEAKLKELRGVE